MFFSWYIDTFFHFSRLPTHGATIQVFGTRRTAAKLVGLMIHAVIHAFLKMRKFSFDAMRCHMSSYKYRYFQRSGWLEKNTKKEHLQLQLQKAQMTQDTDSRASRSCSPFAGAASSPWRRNMQPQRNILFTDFFTNS